MSDPNELNELWEYIDSYQAKADAAGHGDSWRRMRQERTLGAAKEAMDAARAIERALKREAWVATGAVVMATNAFLEAEETIRKRGEVKP